MRYVLVGWLKQIDMCLSKKDSEERVKICYKVEGIPSCCCTRLK